MEAETARQAALRRYWVVGTTLQERFDRLTRMASRHFGAAAAAVNFVGAEQQWTKSCCGLEASRPTLREMTFCQYTVQRAETLIVEDACKDARFAALPMVKEAPHFRFYAGAPLRTPAGYGIGSLCIMDPEPRSFDSEARSALQDFAAMAMDALEQKRLWRERGEAEKARQRSEERHRHLIGRSSDIVSVMDPEGTVRYESAAVEKVLGRSPATGAKAIFQKVVHPEDRQRVEDAVQAVREQPGCVKSVEFRGHHADGRWIALESVMRNLVEDAAIKGIVVNTRDVTERKEREEALRESEARFRTIFKNVQDIIFKIDGEGRFVLLSPSWKEVTGYSVEESLGVRYTDYMEPEHLTVEHYRERIGESNTFTDRVRFRTRSGELRWVRMRARILRDDDGRIVGGVGTLSDVTDSLQMKAERDARERAEELLEAKNAFLNNMSHELRTPLASILGFAEVLADEVEGVHREFAGRIGQSGRRLRDTLNSILELAQSEQDGGAGLDYTSVDVAAAARRAADAYRATAEEKGLAFSVETPEAGEACAYLDENALGRVIDNLVVNAIKFTEEGSVAITVEAKEQQVRLAVADTGIGIGEDFQDKIFDDFAQESRGISRTHTGSGLGLSIARRLVESMDGALCVSSSPGAGTVFTVAFSREALPHAEGADRPPADAAPDDPMEDAPVLLLVEDNSSTRALAERMLCRDYQVESIPNGKALNLTKHVHFDACLIDINLGDGKESGVDLMHRLRAQPGGEDVPAIAFTAHAMPGDEKRYRDAGFDGYLAKPFSKADLLGVVEEALAQVAAASS